MNNNSRIQNSIKNISFGLLTQLIQMVLGFVSRTVFIHYLAIEYLGVSGLFTSILTMLSLAELGVSSAFLYSLYKPLADKNEAQIAALICFFKKIYLRIAAIVASVGLLILPFLTNIVDNPPQQLAHDLHFIYVLFLFNTVASYLFYYKISLFHADQKSYVIAKRNIVVFVIQNSLQILSLVFFQNFLLYLFIQLISQLGGNLYLSQLVKRHYPFLSTFKNEEVDQVVKRKIFSNVKSTAIVKVGGLAVNNTSNIILNHFSGLKAVGLLSNYMLLIGLASGLIMQVFSGLTGSIANVNVKEPLEKKRDVFFMVNFANFWIFGLSTTLIILLINDFIILWIGIEYTLTLPVVCALALNFFMVGMQNAVWTFKSTFGLFKEGRWLILGTALINIVLSLILGNYYGLFGILISIAIARALTNSWYDPYVVFTKALQQPPKAYFIRYVFYVLFTTFITFGLMVLFYFYPLSGWIALIGKFFVSMLVFNGIAFFVYRKTPEFEYIKNVIIGLISKSRAKLFM